MNNMEIYDATRKVPKEAIKLIEAGRLKGMSDINPMWRIKTLTEQFGACGDGWKYEIASQHMEHGAEGQIASFVNIMLYYKLADDTWSQPIPGTGGSMFVSKERNGLYTDDECFKKALTDALSVACKALGIGADIYFSKDTTKYTSKENDKMGFVDKIEAKLVIDAATKKFGSVDKARDNIKPILTKYNAYDVMHIKKVNLKNILKELEGEELNNE